MLKILFVCLFVCVIGENVSAATTVSYNATTKRLVVTMPAGGNSCKITTGTGPDPAIGGTPVVIIDDSGPVAFNPVAINDVEQIVVHGGSGDDDINLSDVHVLYWPNISSVALWGKAGSDTIKGSGIDDVIYGGTGADVIKGQGGNNVLLDYDAGDTVSTCAAIDVEWDSLLKIAKLKAAPGSTAFEDLELYDSAYLAFDAQIGGKSLVHSILWTNIDILEIHGTDDADTIDCTSAPTTAGWINIYGKGGDDQLTGSNRTGSEYRESFYGGTGSDTIDGKAGDEDYLMDAESVDVVSNCMRRIWYFDTATGNDWLTSSTYANVVAGSGFQNSGFTTYGQTRRKGKNSGNPQKTAIGNTFGPAMYFQVKKGHIAPDLLSSNGTISTWLGRVATTGGTFGKENHCMFCVNRDGWPGGQKYVKQQIRYRYVLDVSLNSQAGDYGWNVVVQVHPGTFPAWWRKIWDSGQTGTEYEIGQEVSYLMGGVDKIYRCKAVGNQAQLPTNTQYWDYVRDGTAASQSPPIAVRIDNTGQGANWVFEVRGTTGAQSTEYTHTYHGSQDHAVLPFQPGLHQIIIDFTFDTITGANGYARCSVDGVKIGEVPDQPIGVVQELDGQSVAGFVSAGTYVGGLPHVPAPAPTNGPPTADFISAMLYEE